MTEGGVSSILWIAPEIVDVAQGGGGGIRQAQLLRRITRMVPTRIVALGPTIDDEVANQAADVRLLDPPVADKTAIRSAVRASTGRSLPEIDAAKPFRSSVPRAWLADHAATVVLNHLSMAPLIGLGDGRSVLHLFHSPADHLGQEARRHRGQRRLRLRRYAASGRRLERAAIGRADLTVFVCEQDRVLMATGLSAQTAVVPNGVDLDAFATSGELPEQPVVLFPGTLFYGPNVDGALHFSRHVWPSIRAAVPEAQLVIAGRRPVPEIRALDGQEGVEVQADVPDMRVVLERARVVVVPLRYGSGSRLKALEAVAARRTVVGTRIGLQGFVPALYDHIAVSDSDDEFAALVVDGLLRPRTDARRAARAIVEAHYGWDALAESFAEALGGVGSR